MKKSGKNCWLIALCFAMVLIALAILIMNIVALFICNKELSVSVVVEANVISLIGLAITTWVGLNIIERIDRTMIQNLEDQSEILKEEVTKLQGQAKSLSEQFSITNRQERLKLLEDLRLDRGIGISKWIYRQLLDMSEASHNVDIWRAFREEEACYHQLEQTYDQNEIETIASHIGSCLDTIREQAKCLNKSDARILEDVLLLRETEILFTKAYRQKWTNSAEQRACFVSVTQKYTQSGRSKIFRWPSISESYEYKIDCDELMSILEKIEERDCPIMAHMFNFIGDAYSELVWYDICQTPSDVATRAVEANGYLSLNYCLLAVCSAIKGKYDNESYYRNYGCAIERVYHRYKRTDKNKYVQNLESAISQYYQALHCDSTNSSIYHCLASAYNKIFESLTGIEIYAEDGIKDSQKNDIKEKAKGFMVSYKRIKDLYLMLFPQEWKAHLMSALYYRDMYILYKSTSQRAVTYAKKLNQAVSQLEILRPSVVGTKITVDRNAIRTEAKIALK